MTEVGRDGLSTAVPMVRLPIYAHTTIVQYAGRASFISRLSLIVSLVFNRKERFGQNAKLQRLITFSRYRQGLDAHRWPVPLIRELAVVGRALSIDRDESQRAANGVRSVVVKWEMHKAVDARPRVLLFLS